MHQFKQHRSKLLISFALVGLIAAGTIWGIIPWIAENRFQQMLTSELPRVRVGNGGVSRAKEIAGFGRFGLPAICRHLQSSDASERRTAAYVLIFYGRRAQGCRAAIGDALKMFDGESHRQVSGDFYVGSFSVAMLLVEKAYTMLSWAKMIPILMNRLAYICIPQWPWPHPTPTPTVAGLSPTFLMQTSLWECGGWR
jgi:hypothetical protein